MSKLQQVHITAEEVASQEMSPPHPPRVDTPEYRKSHTHLVETLDSPCVVCGVRRSTLGDPAQNPFGARAMETHHYPVERSLVDACDPTRVGRVFPQVIDQATLQAFVDSPANLLVLCDIHHRDPELGIHHLLTQDWVIQPFLLEGYRVAARAEDSAEREREDAVIVDREGGNHDPTTQLPQ